MDQVAKPTWILRKFHMDTIKVILLNLWRFQVLQNLCFKIQYFHSYKNSVGVFFQELFMSTTPVTIQPNKKQPTTSIHALTLQPPPKITPSQIRTSAKSRRTGLSLKADSTSLGLCRIEAFPKRQRNLGERWKKVTPLNNGEKGGWFYLILLLNEDSCLWIP